MKKKIIDKLTNFIIQNKKCSDKDIKIYRYGLEGLYNQVTKTIVLLIITLFLKTYKEYFLLILFYTLLRLFAYGIHANTSIGCWLTSIPIYLGGSFFIKYAICSKELVTIVWLIYLLVVILWAPADTKKRPLIRRKRRIILKIESLIIAFIYGLLICYISNNKILNVILFSTALEAICICPITYYLTGNRFNNYIYYNKTHGLN